MIFMPFQILGIWFRGLLAIAILAGGLYWLDRWYDESFVTVPQNPPAQIARANDPADRRSAATDPPAQRRFEFHPGWNKPSAWLGAATLLLVWGTMGGLVRQGVAKLVSVRAGSGAPQRTNEPRPERTGEVHHVARPDGSQIRVECYGPAEAPPIVFTHGWGGNSTAFFYAKRGLAGQFRLILWDEPGLGLSKKPDNNDFSLEKFAADLHAVLQLAGQPAVLVGHSIGGMILLTYCRLFRETLHAKVAGLALVHTTYKDPVQTTKGAALYTWLEKPVLVPMMALVIGLYPIFWALTWLSYWNGSLHRSTAKSSFAGTETQAQLNFCTSWTPRARPDIVARGMLGMMAYDETATLPEIDVPTLVVVGDKDTTTPAEAGQFMASRIRGAELATLAPARHMGLIEQHGAFEPLLGRFSAACFAARDFT